MSTLTQRQTTKTNLKLGGGKPQDASTFPNEMPIQGVAKLAPSSWVPYVQLMRLDRPGFLGFFMPTLTGLTAGAGLSKPLTSPTTLLKEFAFWWLVTNLIRGTSCTWNDNVDQDFDRQVPRTRTRPIARGAVSTTQAHIFTLVQLAITCWSLSHLPPQCFPWTITLIVTHTIYPLCKRFMDFTPVFLGLPFSASMMLPAVGLGLDPFSLPAGLLFGAEFTWTVIYETIYAHQDVQHDVQAGVKSMAVRFKDSTKTLASCLSVVMVGFLVAIGVVCEMSAPYFLVSCVGTAISLAIIISSVDLTKPESCLYWFRTGFYIVGGSKVGGFAADYLVSLLA
ncbi:UbiA prenyltransferase family-domain-containing protein [Penicillium angulare]|uniref:UbiA prenyltransferase family-domain-containing protein n=1 Tax=Penicillium angulare TaxID=116970 RepID=UPI002540EAAE|nr:UbiA prenyltransferase family-domain-containing protein [Penicillium angulare]KAJ5281520.1 UbiA prenyltransferase family-domain-containing protein [Penicillium angulare]